MVLDQRGNSRAKSGRKEKRRLVCSNEGISPEHIYSSATLPFCKPPSALAWMPNQPLGLPASALTLSLLFTHRKDLFFKNTNQIMSLLLRVHTWLLTAIKIRNQTLEATRPYIISPRSTFPHLIFSFPGVSPCSSHITSTYTLNMCSFTVLALAATLHGAYFFQISIWLIFTI